MQTPNKMFRYILIYFSVSSILFCQKDVEERKKETKSAEFELVSTKIKLAKEESKTNKENKTDIMQFAEELDIIQI